jgi:hypothetical protein
MKTLILISAITLALVVAGLLLWQPSDKESPSAHQGTTYVTLSGTDGGGIAGYHVRDGKRVTFSKAVPIRFEYRNISEFEFRKLHAEDSLVVDLRYDSQEAKARLSKVLEPGVVGLRGRVENGLIAQTILPTAEPIE